MTAHERSGADVGVEPELAAEFVGLVEGTNVPTLRTNVTRFWRGHHDHPDAVGAVLMDLWSRCPGTSGTTVRMGVAITLGPVAVTRPEAMSFLLGVVPGDADWRVQEALAKGFDWYCAESGWATAVPMIEAWITHNHVNVRRAASEGPRVWTKRPHFDKHPELAIELLGRLRADREPYVRKSVANALSDVSKTHPDLTLPALSEWSREPNAAWVVRNACRHLVKTHPVATEPILAATKG
ncbi:DNA alkylation repair protein [Frankia sp. Cr1]|uniref:DNA alkylation repair protein n=1 Tax=Frankia sp. Cr1 TaxID=3073931 RepID=UPI002AD4E1F8|nr:DNA alkylation repair protein [Frankia sp. Cr1]